MIPVLRGWKCYYFWAQKSPDLLDPGLDYFLNPEIITMTSGPIVDGFHFWRRRSLLKREMIAQNISHNSWSYNIVGQTHPRKVCIHFTKLFHIRQLVLSAAGGKCYHVVLLTGMCVLYFFLQPAVLLHRRPSLWRLQNLPRGNRKFTNFTGNPSGKITRYQVPVFDNVSPRWRISSSPLECILV